MNQETGPQLVFESEFDDRTAFEAEMKGWFSAAAVRLPGGRVVPVCFFDPIRLSQDVTFAFERGQSCFTEPGLIVVPKITVECMVKAVLQCFAEGYFDQYTAGEDHDSAE